MDILGYQSLILADSAKNEHYILGTLKLTFNTEFMDNGRIVDKINNSIGQDPTAKSIIGVLDIYGFESFKINRYIMIFSVNFRY